ncbi:MAG TPA: TRAP transporter substrate-binding protein [Methylomirabilota bacterium]|nr:TRAP transporter substrate-binding protein [Methylomirabilota bacterium]
MNPSRRGWTVPFVTGVAVGVLALLATQWVGVRPRPAEAQRPTLLRVQASFPPASLLFTNLQIFATRVEKISGGRLKIEALPAGSIVPAFEVADAANRGVIDGAHTCTYYFIGKHKAAALFTDVPGGPYGMDPIDFWGWEYHGGGVELLNEFYQNVLRMKIVAMPIFPTTAQSLGWFKKEIKSAKDLVGLKYRVPGIAADVFKGMGVAVVTLPGGEVMAAGERGVLDATEWYTPAEDIKLGFHNVWKYYHYPSAHETAGACDLLINKDVWDKLAPDLQEVIRSAALDAAFRSLLHFNRADAEALRELRDKLKVNLVRTPDDIIRGQLAVWDKIAQTEAAKDPFFKKVLDSQRTYAELVVPFRRTLLNPYDVIARHYFEKK